jgi:hypothetical protein
MKQMQRLDVVESSLFLSDLSGRIFEWAQALSHHEDAAKGGADVVEGVAHRSRRVGSKHIKRSHWRSLPGTMRGSATCCRRHELCPPQNRKARLFGQTVAFLCRVMEK